MPTRFPFSKTNKWGLTVMVREEARLDTLHSAVSSKLSECKGICLIVNQQLQAPKLSDGLLEIASHYFLTPREKIDDSDLATIKSVVNKVWTGLSGDVTIKTGENVGKAENWDQDRKETDDYGQVTAREIRSMSRRRFGRKKPKPYHNKHVWARDGKKYRFGAIKIAQDVLSDEALGPVVIIHEATHKYAGTWDCWHYDDHGIVVEKMFTMSTDKTLALQNADSYAWFMWYVSGLASTSLGDWDDESQFRFGNEEDS
jgi:hypothetical protein